MFLRFRLGISGCCGARGWGGGAFWVMHFLFFPFFLFLVLCGVFELWVINGYGNRKILWLEELLGVLWSWMGMIVQVDLVKVRYSSLPIILFFYYRFSVRIVFLFFTL